MILEFKDINKMYGKNHAVKELNITMGRGIWGLLGPNGAGKTSLINMLTTNMKPSRGHIYLDGNDIYTNTSWYCDKIGYLPQHFGYIKELSLWDFLVYIGTLKDIKKEILEQRIEELLLKVSLLDFKNKKIDTFSGGMKRRVGIVQALLNDPQILILDEPTVGLDIEERRKFREILTKFSKDRFVLISTHIVSDIEFIADNIVIMNKGEIKTVGKTDILLKSLQGRIYEGIVDLSRLDELKNRVDIINYHNLEKNKVKVRFFSSKDESSNFIEVMPNLEDYYFYQIHDLGVRNEK